MRYFLITLTVLLLSSCDCGPKDIKDINCEFKGGLVMGVENDSYHGIKYTIKYDGRVFTSYPYDIYLTYEVGDIINGPCKGEKKEKPEKVMKQYRH